MTPLKYVRVKRPSASARHRKGIAEALVTVTTALVPVLADAPAGEMLRRALHRAFNAPEESEPVPPELTKAVAWLARRSPQLADVANPAVLRKTLEAIGRTLDSRPAATATVARKRATLNTVLEYAVELEFLDSNPLRRTRTRPRIPLGQVDRRVVVNPNRRLRAPRRRLGDPPMARIPPGRRRCQDRLRHDRRGTLSETPRPGGDRPAPGPSELVSALHRHLDQYGTAGDGPLFVTRTGKAGVPVPKPYLNPVAMGTVFRARHRAQNPVLIPEQVASPLARRPLRPAASVCGQDDIARRRIEEALR